ncbi:DNA/RNA non-specific endonuclease [Acaryochloris marina]|uniref:DNA/RNA non-specific endonuclease n=1 Tax=Acaryochloris marina TaxID=155978 RepID=UPI0021C2664F|nr:DNA/RNA non-specific endonuclease [Acaryochloris marina]BDM83817.1 hypothetical protein AM10699_66780 [Acaryochloris marina MBIC10699]
MARLPYIIPYDPNFLGDGFQVPLPIPKCRGKLVRSGGVIDYIHFSLVMHRDRKSALYTAHNIDNSQRQSVERTGWDLDPRIERRFQTGNEAYRNNDWDRGHLVRRAAVAWGTPERADAASDSTFYYTNAALQHEKFNQDEWLALENWVLQGAGGTTSRLCVFTGPIYTQRDQFERSFRIPSAFWKIAVLRDPTAAGDDLSAVGFVMKQNQFWDDWNGASTLDLQVYQVGLHEIGRYTGLEFGDLESLDEFELRHPRFRDRSRMKPIPIKEPSDIKFFGDRRRAKGIRAIRLGPPPVKENYELTAPIKNKKNCGCTEPASLQEQVKALAQQLELMKEVVDDLLTIDEVDDDTQRKDARQHARLISERIVGGQKTATGEFLDCACIGDVEFNGTHWFCTGVLIHERVVLTAAHCAPFISRVYLGGESINLINFRGEVKTVERVIIHPDYDENNIPWHDLAVLILDSPAQTQPISIATTKEVNSEDNLTLVGFGYEHPTLDIGFGTKRKVDVPLTTASNLTATERDEFEILHGFDTRYELFAGRKFLGADSCKGDSGGPAYIVIDGKYKLAGITSRAAFSSSIRCGDGGVYTRVAPYLPWIESVTDGLVTASPDIGRNTPGESPLLPFIYISSAQPNPAGPDLGNEWVELTNSGNAPVSLTSYMISDRQGGREALTGSLSPGSKIRISLPSNSSVKLGNSGDDIILSHDNKEIHRVSYSKVGSGEIITFAPPQPPDNNGGNPPVVEEPNLVDADPC